MLYSIVQDIFSATNEKVSRPRDKYLAHAMIRQNALVYFKGIMTPTYYKYSHQFNQFTPQDWFYRLIYDLKVFLQNLVPVKFLSYQRDSVFGPEAQNANPKDFQQRCWRANTFWLWRGEVYNLLDLYRGPEDQVPQYHKFWHILPLYLGSFKRNVDPKG